VEGAAMFLFAAGKAKTASRGREIFPSGKILVTTQDKFRSAKQYNVHKQDFTVREVLFAQESKNSEIYALRSAESRSILLA